MLVIVAAVPGGPADTERILASLRPNALEGFGALIETRLERLGQE